MSEEKIEIKRGVCKHCGKEIARIPIHMDIERLHWKFMWLHLSEDKTTLKEQCCSMAEPKEKEGEE